MAGGAGAGPAGHQRKEPARTKVPAGALAQTLWRGAALGLQKRGTTHRRRRIQPPGLSFTLLQPKGCGPASGAMQFFRVYRP